MTIATDTSHRQLMDRSYRYQRHVYDATRKYYLFGRDRMIAELDPPANGSVLEIGCGTGRNLIAIARRYPTARLYGIDISTEMLASAKAAIARAGLSDRITLAEAVAAATDPRFCFRLAGFDRVYFSYTLSMIPEWRSALTRAASALAPGGRLHIVDFGTQRDLPAPFRRMLFAWLSHFHVEPRAGETTAALQALAELRGCHVDVHAFGRGYAFLATMSQPAIGRPEADAPRQLSTTD
ncbi:MAG: methyltransferase domain-containing protein [Hyphomicrobiales bacterium]|nr:methyltransferase domain-containing protein [Hyphomicrobiales bacterium]